MEAWEVGRGYHVETPLDSDISRTRTLVEEEAIDIDDRRWGVNGGEADPLAEERSDRLPKGQGVGGCLLVADPLATASSKPRAGPPFADRLTSLTSLCPLLSEGGVLGVTPLPALHRLSLMGDVQDSVPYQSHLPRPL